MESSGAFYVNAYACDLDRGHLGLHQAETGLEERPQVTWAHCASYPFSVVVTKKGATPARELYDALLSVGFPEGIHVGVSKDGQSLMVFAGPTVAEVEKAVKEVTRTRQYRRYKDVAVIGVRVDGTCM